MNKDYQKANEFYDIAINQNNEYWEAHAQKIQIISLMNGKYEVRNYLDKLIFDYPTKSQVYDLAIDFYKAEKEFDKAIEIAKKASSDAESYRSLFQIEVCELLNNKKASSIEALQCIKILKNNFHNFEHYGSSYYVNCLSIAIQAKDYKEAQSCLSEAKLNYPSSDWSLYQKKLNELGLINIELPSQELPLALPQQTVSQPNQPEINLASLCYGALVSGGFLILLFSLVFALYRYKMSSSQMSEDSDGHLEQKTNKISSSSNKNSNNPTEVVQPSKLLFFQHKVHDGKINEEDNWDEELSDDEDKGIELLKIHPK